MRLGNGFKDGVEYIFIKGHKGLYKIVNNDKKVMYKTYDYIDMMMYFDNVL